VTVPHCEKALFDSDINCPSGVRSFTPPMKLMRPSGRRLRRPLKSLLLLIGAAALAAAALALDLLTLGLLWTDIPAIERENWRRDYQRLRERVEWSYPSLEWTMERRTLVLPELERQARAHLEAAHTRAEARRAMQDFVDAFEDGHFTAEVAERPSLRRFRLSVDTLSRNTPAINACSTLGYDRRQRSEIPFDFEGLADFTPFDDANAFRAGVLVLDGRRIGIVRVPSFNERTYAGSCRDEWERLRSTLTTTCEDRCQRQFWMAVRNRLILHFESRIREFRRAGVELVVVDLTGNHGGHGWSSPLGRALTGRELPRLPVSLLRGPETVAELDGEMKRLDRALAFCPTKSSSRRVLEERYVQLDRARTEALSPCWHGHAWSADEPRVACTQLTTPLRLEGEALAELDAQPDPMRPVRDTLLEPARHRQPRVAWRGRVAVLIDDETASMAELLAGSLKDYGGAVLIGDLTARCGAGWHRGDRPDWLEHVGLELHIPDYVAYRRDGSSYRNGVEPDITVGWEPDDDGKLRAWRLVAALRQLPAFEPAPAAKEAQR
jgi:hypothetical protein